MFDQNEQKAFQFERKLEFSSRKTSHKKRNINVFGKLEWQDT